MLFKSNRGSLSIVILVFLVLFAASSALFSFLGSPQKISVIISDAEVLDNIYSKENFVNFYLTFALENALVKSYDSFILGEKYIGDPVIYNSKGNVEFKNLNRNLNEELKRETTSNFKKEFESFEFDEDYLKSLKDLISQDKFEVFFDGSSFNIRVFEFSLNESFESISVKYTPEVLVNVDFNKAGLNGFSEIYDSKEKCKDEEFVKKCFEENLNHFNINLADDEKSVLVGLSSKKEFLIENQFKKIEMSFVLV